MVKVLGTTLLKPTDQHIEIMRLTKADATKSPCARSHFSCTILDEKAGKMVTAHNLTSCRDIGGLCGGVWCYRNGPLRSKKKIKRGTRLELACVHAEAIARWDYFKAGLDPNHALVFLYGDNGVTLPCITCLKEFLFCGMRRFWIAGKMDMAYRCDPPLPSEWVSLIEYGVIPYRVIE